MLSSPKVIGGDDLIIAGDWGSTRMRLHLCRHEERFVRVVDTRTGPGAKDVIDHEAAFFEAAGPWFTAHGNLPVILSGMIGSNIGWREAGYVACPANAGALATNLTTFLARGRTIRIVPGLSATNLFGFHDVMRGEEVQLFGWLERHAADDGLERLICLPGTHAKWARTRGRTVVSFLTSLQGEIYELLLRHSLLGRSVPAAIAADPPQDPAAFLKGVSAMADHPTLALEHAVFSMRSQILSGDLNAPAAPAFLSGLLIGAELRDGVAAHAALGTGAETVVLIGSRALVDLGIKIQQAVDDHLAIEGLIGCLDARLEVNA
jgi:2-dehydro-3-deoxygalactonokinase